MTGQGATTVEPRASAAESPPPAAPEQPTTRRDSLRSREREGGR